MTPEGFLSYIDGLPEGCIEEWTGEYVKFHIPEAVERPVCPSCHSPDIWFDLWNVRRLRVAGKLFLYNCRRYQCQICGKTFNEDNPFVGYHQYSLSTDLCLRRLDLGFSAVAMAEEVGLSPHIYRRVEKREILPPSRDSAMKMAEIFHTDVQTLWPGIDLDTLPMKYKTRPRKQSKYDTALFRLRQAAGMSQAQVAAAAGVHISTYKRYERGAKNPSLRTAMKIADTLGCHIEDFFEK